MLLLYEVFSNTMQRHDDGMPKFNGLITSKKTSSAQAHTHTNTERERERHTHTHTHTRAHAHDSNHNCKDWLPQAATTLNLASHKLDS